MEINVLTRVIYNINEFIKKKITISHQTLKKKSLTDWYNEGRGKT